ncbi:MAG: hypothetical protein IT282_05355, partial [Bacteroidetes bacterium]|nr:hypothetical protein [Bacteroidota bacterium]
MRFTATLLCMLCITVLEQGFAETITLSGTVKHASSLSPLDSVSIELINEANPSERYSVLTDALGMWSYSFNLTGVGDAA